MNFDWNCEFFRNLRDEEVNELLSHHSLIENVSLKEDHMAWELESSGCFTDKSFFNWLIDESLVAS